MPRHYITSDLGFVSVMEFGADPTGAVPSTQAFIDTANYCAANKKNMVIPDGDFWINGAIPFPNYYAVKGNGYRSNIIVDLPDNGYVWKESAAFKYAWGFEGLRFTLKTGASKNTGGIYLESSMRGAFIKNIWSYDLRRPLYLGDQVWGIVSVENLFFYLLGENLDVATTTPAFWTKGNTIMMSNIEIVGGWNKGLHLEGVSVFKLNGYNVSGSSSTNQMAQAIYVENSDSGEITSGWVEQLVDNAGGANGRTIWANGEGHAIYVKNSKAIKIGESNISTGSIFADNSDVTVDQIKYAQSNAGIKVLNNAKVNATESSIKTQNVGSDHLKSDGEIILNTRTSNSNGLLDNPIMKLGVTHALTATNTGLVTIADEATDYISGDRAIKATITASFQGLFINKSNLKVGKLYTAVLKVKKVSGLDSVYISNGTGCSISQKYPSTLTRSNEPNYHILTYTFTTSASTISIKLQGTLTSGQTQGVILVDAVDIFEGYNVFDPSQQNHSTLGEQGRLKVSAVPTTGAWEVGNKITISTPVAGGYSTYACVVAGTPGTWEPIGVIGETQTVLKSPDGSRFKVTIDNAGGLTTTKL